MIYTVYLSLGSNIPPCVDHLKTAFEDLKALGSLQVSSLYQTPPWGVVDQDPFINACAILKTTLSPERLLTETQAIEQSNGRVRLSPWGARTLDIDLLYVTACAKESEEAVFMQMDSLRLPHPFLFQRAFVLIPLLEIAPDFTVRGIRADKALKGLPEKEREGILFMGQLL